MMSLYTLKQKKLIVFTATLLLGVFIAWSLSFVFTAFLGAIIFYTLFKPFYIYLSQVLGWNKSLSALLILFVSLVCIILPFTGLSLMVADKVIWFKDHPEVISNLLDRLTDVIAYKFNRDEMLDDMLSSIQSWALNTATVAASEITNFFLKLTIMYFVMFYMLVESERFERTLLKYMPFKVHNSMIFANELKNITYSNILGQGLVSIAQGVALGVGFLIFGLEDPLFWTVICIFLSFLPVVGSGLIFIPAGIIAMSDGYFVQGIGILAWGFIVVINVDNFLRMYIGKKFSDTHPLITIVGVVMGVAQFGILGLVFGPLLLSYFILLIKIYEIRYVNRKPLQVSDLKISDKPENSE
jgi:predicted PurR-regulated permease PerM